MSAVSVHPPQTYSRLFRPWDSNKTTSETKSECCPVIKPEEGKNTCYKISDSDSASSSSSSSKSSYDDYLACSPSQLQHPRLCRDYIGESPPPSTRYSPLEPNNIQFSIASGVSNPSDFYYAAAAAAVANGHQPMTTSVPFGMDSFAVSLMEQEYARVMAEDAHLKAINSRKQRPKKFKCPHCEVAFSNNGQLKGHIRIHTGERPFKCDVETCGKTFTRNEELTRHKRIHTGLRPYACTACGKKFGRRDHLKKHMKTHMPQERQLGPAIFVPMYPYLYGY